MKDDFFVCLPFKCANQYFPSSFFFWQCQCNFNCVPSVLHVCRLFAMFLWKKNNKEFTYRFVNWTSKIFFICVFCYISIYDLIFFLLVFVPFTVFIRNKCALICVPVCPNFFDIIYFSFAPSLSNHTKKERKKNKLYSFISLSRRYRVVVGLFRRNALLWRKRWILLWRNFCALWKEKSSPLLLF